MPNNIFATVTRWTDQEWKGYSFDCLTNAINETTYEGQSEEVVSKEILAEHPNATFYSYREYLEYRSAFEDLLLKKTLLVERREPTRVIHHLYDNGLFLTHIGAFSIRYDHNVSEYGKENYYLRYEFNPHIVIPVSTENRQNALRATAQYLKKVLSIIETELEGYES